MKSTLMLTREEALAARRWFVIDAARPGARPGRQSEAAKLLRGKTKPSFTPHVDCGDFVVIINAEHVQLTGTKDETKIYYRHTGYPGGIRHAAAGQAARHASGSPAALGGHRHAAEKPARPPAGNQAEDLYRPGAPARGPTACRDRRWPPATRN